MTETQSTNKRYYWMKFQRDFFKSLRIKKLRRLAGGDTFTIIYLKLQLLSITDGGYLKYKHVLDDFAEEMAEEIDEDVENVALTIQYLINSGLMEMNEDEYFLPYAADNIGSETASAQRVRDYRERKKEEKLLQCNTAVTEVQQPCNTEKEIEKEIEKEDITSSEAFRQVSDLFNSICVSFPKVTKVSAKRARAIRAILKEYGIDEIKNAFIKAEASDFMKTGTWASFDWMMNKNNLLKVIEGNYDNRIGNKPKSSNQFNDFANKQHYDENLEAILIGEYNGG